MHACLFNTRTGLRLSSSGRENGETPPSTAFTFRGAWDGGSPPTGPSAVFKLWDIRRRQPGRTDVVLHRHVRHPLVSVTNGLFAFNSTSCGSMATALVGDHVMA
jgi:hypothetical protein